MSRGSRVTRKELRTAVRILCTQPAEPDPATLMEDLPEPGGTGRADAAIAPRSPVDYRRKSAPR